MAHHLQPESASKSCGIPAPPVSRPRPPRQASKVSSLSLLSNKRVGSIAGETPSFLFSNVPLGAARSDGTVVTESGGTASGSMLVKNGNLSPCQGRGLARRRPARAGRAAVMRWGGQSPITLHLALLITAGSRTAQLLHYLGVSIRQN